MIYIEYVSGSNKKAIIPTSVTAFLRSWPTAPPYFVTPAHRYASVQSIFGPHRTIFRFAHAPFLCSGTPAAKALVAYWAVYPTAVGDTHIILAVLKFPTFHTGDLAIVQKSPWITWIVRPSHGKLRYAMYKLHYAGLSVRNSTTESNTKFIFGGNVLIPGTFKWRRNFRSKSQRSRSLGHTKFRWLVTQNWKVNKFSEKMFLSIQYLA